MVRFSGVQNVVIDQAFESWRDAARVLLQQEIAPERVHWRLRCDTQQDLLGHAHEQATIDCNDANTAHKGLWSKSSARHEALARVPGEFLRLATSVVCHSDHERWSALYKVLYRLTHGEPSLLEVATDPDVHRLMVMDKAVRRDVHKMHAFVRFRAVSQPAEVHSGPVPTYSDQQCETERADSNGARAFVAWFEPMHHIVQRGTPFFARRFASMRWSIFTPRECAHWDGNSLQFTAGVLRSSSPQADELEELWCSYYAHTFNPARVATATMQAEMPQRYWVNLPEAPLIAKLTREAPLRVLRMLQQLDEVPAEIPDELRSCVGDATEPARSRLAQEHEVPGDLNVPDSWNAVHDPGVSAARMRSETPNHSCDVRMGDVPVRVGTASWTDPTLLRRGVFYPDTVTTAEARLNYYASRFSLVEVDSTYYVPPTRSTAALWAARAPDGFVFDIKAFALMTGHAAEVKRMPDWLRRLLPRTVASAERVYAKELSTRVLDEVWNRFQNALSPLSEAGKLGPILLQFPRWFLPTRESAEFLRTARERLGRSAAAVEFRNPAWVDMRMAARTMSLLEKLQLTYVVVDAPPGTASSMPPFAAVTTPDLAVVRLHGRRSDAWEAKHAVVSERYRYLYDSEQLSEWTERIGGIADLLGRSKSAFPDMAKAKQGVHVVFNNCHANYGTTNADEITRMLIEFDKLRRTMRDVPP